MGDDAEENGSPSALERWRHRKSIHSETGHDDDHIHQAGDAESQPPTVAATQRPEAGAVDEISASGEADVPAGGATPADGVAQPGGGAPQHGGVAPPGAAAQAGSKLDRWKSRVAKQAEVTNAAAPPAANPPANAAQAPTSGKLDRWKKRIANQSAEAAGGGASPAGPPGAQQDPMLPTSQGGKRGHPVPITDAWLRRALEKRWNDPLVPGTGGVTPPRRPQNPQSQNLNPETQTLNPKP